MRQTQGGNRWNGRHPDTRYPDKGHRDEAGSGELAPDGSKPERGVHNWHKGSDEAHGIRPPLDKLNFVVMCMGIRCDWVRE